MIFLVQLGNYSNAYWLEAIQPFLGKMVAVQQTGNRVQQGILAAICPDYIVLDLLHNFFLECGARTHKMRVFQMTDHPTAREMIGYLLVRGGVHIVAYAKAIEMATGLDVTKMLPIPSLDNRVFDQARKYEDRGYGNVLFTWNYIGDYEDINKIWKGNHPLTNAPLIVEQGIPKGAKIPDLDELPEEFAPGIGPEEFQMIAKRLMSNM